MKHLPAVLLVALSGAALAPAVEAAALFSEDFSTVPNATALNGLVPAVGGAFNVSVDSAPGALQINSGNVDTTGARRVFDAPFTTALGIGQTLDVTVGLLQPGGTNFFSVGFAGFRLEAAGIESGFFGDSNDDTTGFDLASTSAGGVGEVKSGVNTLPSTVLLTYAYDTGVTTLSVNGTQVATTILAPAKAVNDLQFENNGGGDAKITTINATAVPEPSSLAAIFGGLAVLAGRRRRA